MSDDREAILARRRRFIAIALAGAAAASTACSTSPCLTPDAGPLFDTGLDSAETADAGAMPCLSVDAPPPDVPEDDEDASIDGGGMADAGMADAGMADAGIDDAGAPFDGGKPMPCLTPAREPGE